MFRKLLIVACVLSALALTQPVKADPTASFWTAYKPTVVARMGNLSGTVLEDGRAFVVGGVGYNRAEETAEVYNETTAQWAATAPMHAARWIPQTVRLAGNRVLVLGIGDSQAAGNNTYEVYNVASNAWSQSKAGPGTSWDGRMSALPDGTAIYVDPAGAAVYNATTDLWTPTPVPWDASARWINFAVVLKTGKLLVTTAAGRSYLYDPAAGTWASTGDSVVPTDGYVRATVLGDGRVLAVISRGSLDGTAAQVFDPVSGTWSVLAVPFADLVEVAIGTSPTGSGIVAGGMKFTPVEGCEGCATGFPSKATWVFEPTTDTWVAQPDMHHGRSNSLLLTLTSGVLAVAGYYEHPAGTTSELFVDSIGVTISDATTTEGPSGKHAIQFKITLTSPAPTDLHLQLSTVGGTARAAQDFIAGTFDVLVPAGTRTATGSVKVRGDEIPEETEAFGVRLTGPGVRMVDGEANGTIKDDDLGLCLTATAGKPTCVGVQDPVGVSLP